MTTALRRTDRYPSRRGGQPALLERTDPVVHGEAAGPLDPELLAAYEHHGVLVLPSLFAPSEVERMSAAVDEEVARLAPSGRPEVIREPGGGEVRSIFAFHTGGGALAAVVRDERLVGVARQILGSDVYVHQSRVNLKPGFRGKEFAWHSDFETWHTEDGMPAMRALSCVVALTDNLPWNGPLLVMRGSHRSFVTCPATTPENHHERSLRRQEVGVPDEDSLRRLADLGGIDHCIGPAGTVVFFDCNLMHGSNGNITPDPRRNLFVVYNSVENRLEEPFAAPAPRPEHIASRTFDPV